MDNRLKVLVTDRLRDAGLGATGPRLAVADALQRLGGHRTADEVHIRLAENHALMPRTSVYNELAALSTAGVVCTADVGPGPTVYELENGWHHHFVCRRCGRIRDVACTVGSKPCVTPLEDVGQVDEAQIIFRGTCTRCLMELARLAELTEVAEPAGDAQGVSEKTRSTTRAEALPSSSGQNRSTKAS
jgi:Fe2+ or Zn2+ uptake regulation protein